MILAGSNLTQDGLYSFSISFVKGKNTIPSPTNFLGRVGSASNALHTGSQVLINSSKPNEGCKSKIRGANPKQLVCKQVILVVSMSVSPAEMIAKSTSTLSSWGPYNIKMPSFNRGPLSLKIDQAARGWHYRKISNQPGVCISHFWSVSFTTINISPIIIVRKIKCSSLHKCGTQSPYWALKPVTSQILIWFLLQQ